jgi:hypothetical protein
MGTYELAAQVGNVLADVFGPELVCLNGGNIAPTTRRSRYTMAASACRMISRSSFPDRELLELRAARAERGAMCPGDRRGGLSGAGGRSLVKGEAQQVARSGQRNRTQKLI